MRKNAIITENKLKKSEIVAAILGGNGATLSSAMRLTTALFPQNSLQ
jgi:hypothetical protein